MRLYSTLGSLNNRDSFPPTRSVLSLSFHLDDVVVFIPITFLFILISSSKNLPMKEYLSSSLWYMMYVLVIFSEFKFVVVVLIFHPWETCWGNLTYFFLISGFPAIFPWTSRSLVGFIRFGWSFLIWEITNGSNDQ